MKHLISLLAVVLVSTFANAVEVNEKGRVYTFNDAKLGRIVVRAKDVREMAHEPILMTVTVDCMNQPLVSEQVCHFREVPKDLDRPNPNDPNDGMWNAETRTLTLRFSKVAWIDGVPKCEDHVRLTKSLENLCSNRKKP